MTGDTGAVRSGYGAGIDSVSRYRSSVTLVTIVFFANLLDKSYAELHSVY